MSDSPAPLPPPEIEPLRIILPSAIGRLGIEFTGEAVTRLVIAPDRREQRLFTPYAKSTLR